MGPHGYFRGIGNALLFVFTCPDAMPLSQPFQLTFGIHMLTVLQLSKILFENFQGPCASHAGSIGFPGLEARWRDRGYIDFETMYGNGYLWLFV